MNTNPHEWESASADLDDSTVTRQTVVLEDISKTPSFLSGIGVHSWFKGKAPVKVVSCEV